MPFIWDDFDWMLVDEDDSYDKNRFVVIRKLRVRPIQYDVANAGFSIELIRRHFRKFGEIESIEMLPNDNPEAHVTFVSDRSACFVQSHYELDKKMNKVQPYEVEPAYTWEQPLENANSPPEHDIGIDDEQTSKIFTLNEDCLLHLFKFLDLDSLVNMAFVCKIFNRLLRQHSFPHIRKYKVSCGQKSTLAKVRRTMLCIGRHITDFSFQADYYHEEHEWDGELFFVDNDRSSKFLKVIAQNVSQNIRRALLRFGVGERSRIMTIAPILQYLESFEIADYEQLFDDDINFHLLCPNLIEFKVNIRMPMVACCKPWPSLRSLSVLYNSELKPKTLMSFIVHNPQLICLEFSVYYGNHSALFTAITKHLTGLEKLTIWFNKYYISDNFVENFDGLGELSLLREFTLMGLKADNLKGVIDHLPRFENLRKLVLIGGSQHSEIINYGGLESMVNLARKLLFLEELHMLRIPMKEETLVDIVRFGRQLKVLKIHSCKLVFSDELIFKLVDALKCYRQESDEALQLLLPKGDLGKLDVAKNKEIEGYLRLDVAKNKEIKEYLRLKFT